MYLDSLAAAANGGGGAQMGPNPASLGVGKPPQMPGLPPPPTGAGAMPTGSPTTTKMTAGADAISSLRSLQGFVPEMFHDINEFIGRIKGATSQQKGQNPGPAVGEPGVPGALQLDGAPTDASGGPGGF
jgi:hypothetical protein